jgi:hypothetical protein
MVLPVPASWKRRTFSNRLAHRRNKVQLVNWRWPCIEGIGLAAIIVITLFYPWRVSGQASSLCADAVQSLFEGGRANGFEDEQHRKLTSFVQTILHARSTV